MIHSVINLVLLPAAMLLLEKLINSQNYHCKRLYYYTTMLYGLVIIFCTALHTYVKLRRSPLPILATDRIAFISLVVMVISIILDMILNLIGFFWIVGAYYQGRICIGYIDIFVAVISQLKVIFVLCLGMLGFLYICLFRNCLNSRPRLRLVNKRHRNYLSALKSIYLQEKHVNKKYVKKLLNKREFIDFLKQCQFSEEENLYLDEFYSEHFADKKEGSSKDDRCCAICLDTMNSGDLIYRLDCHHIFHCGCVSGWFEKKLTCPLCKDSIREKIIKHIYNELDK